MAEANTYVLWAALLVAAVAASLMWNLSRKAKPQAAEAPGAAPSGPGQGPERLLLRFVHDETGQRKGETVAVDGDNIIVKTPDGFASVPAAQLVDEGGNLKVAGAVDWDAARRVGEEWRSRSYKEITYSPEEVPKEEP